MSGVQTLNNTLYSVLAVLLDLEFTKNDFWHYVYVKFNIFSVKYFLEENAILSYKPVFTQIRFSRVILTI